MNREQIQAVLKFAITKRHGEKGEDYWGRRAQIPDILIDSLYGKDATIEIDGFTVKKVDSFGGYEGSGEHMSVVFSLTNTLTNEVTYVQYSGFYSSYGDSEYDDEFQIVEPVQVQVTQWKTKE